MQEPTYIEMTCLQLGNNLHLHILVSQFGQGIKGNCHELPCAVLLTIHCPVSIDLIAAGSY